MNDSIKQLSLDFHQSSSREEVKIKKGDNKRQIRISLVDGGKPYRISEGCYAAMTGTKPDGKKVFNECSIDGNTIVYKVTNQTSAVPGVVNCEVVLYDADDQRITSSKFTILVVDTEYTEGDDIESSDEVSFLTGLIGDAVGAINNANTAAQKANDVASDLLQAKEDGEFKGEPGKDYVLTEADKKEIAEIAAEMVDVPENGGNVDLTGYATEQFVRDGFQPKGDYLTAVPDGYAKTDDIPTKPEEVGADPKGAAASAVAQHNTATASHNDIRLELKAINDRLTAFFDSDNQTLDELSEIVAYITSNKTLIDSITTSKVSVADIINNLTTNVSNKPLSAAQGVALKGLIDSLSNSLANYQPKGDYALRSEIPIVPANVSAFANDAGYQTAAEVESIVEEAMKDIPAGGGGGATDPVEAWKDLASATIAKADAVAGTLVDTGLTFGDLKQYKEIIFRIGTPNSGPNLLDMRVLIKTNQAVDWYNYPFLFRVVNGVKSANIAKISFANSQKDIWSCVIGVGSAYDAFQNDLGTNNPFLTGNAAIPYELYGMQTYHKKSSAMTDSDHIQFYFNADAPADIRYKITGVFQ